MSPSKSKYAQLADKFREMIRSGDLKVGDRLPSYTEMYRQYGATPATAQRVCDMLEQEQLIERRAGSGIYVAQPKRALTGNIGFIGSGSFKTPKLPFYQHLMEAMQQTAGAQRRHLLSLGTDRDWDVSASDKIDGLVLCNIENPEAILQALPPHLPRVSILTIVDSIISVGIDDYRGAQMAVRHLMSHGHKRIACLMEKSPSEARRRFAGYSDALLEAGIEPDPQWARLSDALGTQLTSPSPQPYREWGRAQMADWLQNGWDETGCTAIVVQNEVAAIGVMQMLEKAGVAVPEQVSIVCFDGTEICDLVSPQLSAVELPLAEIGTRAIEILSRQIDGEERTPQTIMLPLRLKPGESVAGAQAKQAVLAECR